ncbi:MAG: hypothetical protein MJ201_01315 [Mycoplasmoidaceae bacterium]|nr:hypothetical protein [Mycoplasmoidaceae bacterium]
MNKSEISKNYNIDKIVTAKELVSLSQTYKDNLDTIIVMMKRKERKPSKIDLLIQEFRSFKKEVLSRLDKHDELFKQHG